MSNADEPSWVAPKLCGMPEQAQAYKHHTHTHTTHSTVIGTFSSASYCCCAANWFPLFVSRCHAAVRSCHRYTRDIALHTNESNWMFAKCFSSLNRIQRARVWNIINSDVLYIYWMGVDDTPADVRAEATAAAAADTFCLPGICHTHSLHNLINWCVVMHKRRSCNLLFTGWRQLISIVSAAVFAQGINSCDHDRWCGEMFDVWQRWKSGGSLSLSLYCLLAHCTNQVEE